MDSCSRGEAERDFAQIIRWTAAWFGPKQAGAYAEALKALISVFRAGPDPLGFRARDEIGAGFHTLHMRAIGQRGRHFALYRVHSAEIHIVRILHDSMDLTRHIPSADSNPD